MKKYYCPICKGELEIMITPFLEREDFIITADCYNCNIFWTISKEDQEEIIKECGGRDNILAYFIQIYMEHNIDPSKFFY
ncbi:MAG: hypothetical protein ACTSRP_07440 [Candidatus Helarchaeota archaeon]